LSVLIDSVVDPVARRLESQSRAVSAPADDLSRNVYCVLGIPVDVVDTQGTLRSMDAAAAARSPFLVSTPNLNFLISARADSEFRESLLSSDLCLADGISVFWVARLIGVPIRSRVPGADFFEALRTRPPLPRKLNVFLFGGDEGVASAASNALNKGSGGLGCVGWLNPGFGSVDDMSQLATIDKINRSNADLLSVSLGAKKGQLWLLRNHRRLTIPVRAHLGAIINFQAGVVRRAPAFLRRVGFEWLWRIKEEPWLWRRYYDDGLVLMRLLVLRVLPLAVWNLLGVAALRASHMDDVEISHETSGDCVRLSVSGAATARHVDYLSDLFRSALLARKGIRIDFSKVRFVDSRFLGLLLMLRKKARESNQSLVLAGLSPLLRILFRMNGLGFLLSSGAQAHRLSSTFETIRLTLHLQRGSHDAKPLQ
jgi:N-acetylglucosaminyldiphosphoundecaprenol N-acetyl-beta-D-mannosaminyltransferase